jgi:prephenate dehydrogenase
MKTRDEDSPADIRRVRVIGAGLIGTSVGLALRRTGIDVLLADRDQDRVQLATALGAGVPDHDGLADVCVIAVPPQETAKVIAERIRLGLDLTVTDCASVKSHPLREAEALSPELSSYVGGHPIAGRERAGPAAGRADLFSGRPWIVAPHPVSTRSSVEAVTVLVRQCGAAPVTMTPAEHDRVLAVLSHLPQLVASALAAEAGSLPDGALSLAGQGLEDMTRIADSPAALWAAIGAANAGALVDALEGFGGRLASVASVLRDGESSEAQRQSTVAGLVRAGGTARRRFPGKHGGPRPDFVAVAVAVPDEPGELGRLFADIGHAEVNIEDFSVEHEPARPIGIVTLAVQTQAAHPLRAALAKAGWSLYR